MFFSCKSIVLVFAAAFVGQAAAAPHAMPMPFRKLQREVGVRADAATTNTFPENQPAMAPTGGDVEAYHNKRVVKRIQPAPEDINWIRSDIPTSAVDGFIRELPYDKRQSTTNTFPENQPAMAPTGGDVEAYHNKRVEKRMQPAPEDINWIRSDIPTSAVDGVIRELSYDRRQSTTNTFPENLPAMAPEGGDAIAYSNAPAAA